VSLTRLAINALALVAAALLVPGLRIRWEDDTVATLVTVVLLAVVMGGINTFVRPVLRLLSLPFDLVTLGLFSFVMNGGLLLLLAGVLDAIWRPVLVVGGFPPSLSAESFVAALAGSFVISVVSTTMALLVPGA
jgi:putative membrane protein